MYLANLNLKLVEYIYIYICIYYISKIGLKYVLKMIISGYIYCNETECGSYNYILQGPKK